MSLRRTEPSQRVIKVLVVGKEASGKGELIKRIVNGKSAEFKDKHEATQGVQFYAKFSIR